MSVTDPYLGTLLGQTRLDQLLGQGGMGRVYRGYQALLQRMVAVKIILPEYAVVPGFTERFLREAQVMAALQHPHVGIIYHIDYRPMLYVEMEFHPGGSLRRFIGQPIAPAIALPLILQVAQGLHHAHVRGVVHRDVKPDNILIAQDGRAVLADFGLVKILSAVSGSASVVGTPAYMSPEQLFAPARVDGRVDIYALCLVLYELLAGERPVQPGVPPLPIQTVLNAVPTEITTILQQGLATDPAQRYSSVAHMILDLQAAIRCLSGSTKPLLRRPGLFQIFNQERSS